MGDKSDDIPGVAGVGEKTALDLIKTYGDLEGVYAHLSDLRESVRNKLEAGRDMAFTSRTLATICRSVPIEADVAAMKPPEPDNDKLFNLFTRLEFKTLIKRMGLTPGQAQKKCDIGFCPPEVSETGDLAALLGALEGRARVGLCCAPGFAAVALSDGERAWCVTPEGCADFDAFLRALFSDNIKKAGHDVRALTVDLLDRGIEPGGFVFDCTLGGYLLNPGGATTPLSAWPRAIWGRRRPSFRRRTRLQTTRRGPRRGRRCARTRRSRLS